MTMLGICGVRLSWLRWVFPKDKTFLNIMLVFPISLATTALLMLAAALYSVPRTAMRICRRTPMRLSKRSNDNI